MQLLELLKTFVVEGANLVNTANVATLFGLLVLLMFLADQAWKRSPIIKRSSMRAGAAAFTLYLILMLVNFGQFEAAFLASILWRGLLAGALMTGIASVALGVVALLLAEPARWIGRQFRNAVDTQRRRVTDRRQRMVDAQRAAEAAALYYRDAPRREQAEREAAEAARRRHEFACIRDRIRYDLSLEFKRIRKLDPEILTDAEFAAQLDHALAPDDRSEIDRRVDALREVFAAVLAKVPKSPTFESLSEEFVERHAAIDRSNFDAQTKAKLHRWVNLHGEHEVQRWVSKRP